MQYLHTMVRVTDLDVSLRFYRDALGLEVLSVREVPQGRFTLAFLAAPGNSSAQVELTYNWDPETYTGGRNFGHLAYAVDDIYATCARLQAPTPRHKGLAIFVLVAGARIETKSNFKVLQRHRVEVIQIHVCSCRQELVDYDQADITNVLE